MKRELSNRACLKNPQSRRNNKGAEEFMSEALIKKCTKLCKCKESRLKSPQLSLLFYQSN